MITKLTSFFKFSNQVIANTKNSINPVKEHVAYGYYFPKEWNEEHIYSHIDPSRKNISHLQVMKNRVGQPTGKVLFKFYTSDAMERYIEKYNEDFIVTKEEAHRIVLKPFQLKTVSNKSETSEKRTNHAVRIKNLDFDISIEELQRLGKDYGQVEFVEMQIRPNGLNNGLATIYFKKSKEAEDFSYFCHDLVLRERKLSAEVINMRVQNNAQITYLSEPKVFIEANQRLYKRMVAEQVQKKEEKEETN